MSSCMQSCYLIKVRWTCCSTDVLLVSDKIVRRKNCMFFLPCLMHARGDCTIQSTALKMASLRLRVLSQPERCRSSPNYDIVSDPDFRRDDFAIVRFVHTPAMQFGTRRAYMAYTAFFYRFITTQHTSACDIHKLIDFSCTKLQMLTCPIPGLPLALLYFQVLSNSIWFEASKNLQKINTDIYFQVHSTDILTIAVDGTIKLNGNHGNSTAHR